MPQIINEMLYLHSPILGHYPLLLVSVWHAVVSWYKVTKQFHDTHKNTDLKVFCMSQVDDRYLRGSVVNDSTSL